MDQPRPCYKCGSLDILSDNEVIGRYLQDDSKLVTRGFVECLSCYDAFITAINEEAAIKIWNMIYELQEKLRDNNIAP